MDRRADDGQAPEAALDLCCGPGRHCLELRRRGLRVTGVDRTAGYLAQARSRAAQEGLDGNRLEFVEADMREFVRPGAFQLVVNLYTSFGYFEDPADDVTVLANIERSLCPGGTLIMDLASKEVVARIFTPRDWQQLGDGSFMLEEREVVDSWAALHNRWVCIREGEIYETRITLRLYSAAGLSRLLQEVGFSDVKTFGALDGRAYDHAAERLVIVARR